MGPCEWRKEPQVLSWKEMFTLYIVMRRDYIELSCLT